MPNIFNDTADRIENNKNKVTVITSEVTDEQYPSAKAVVEALNSKPGEKTLNMGEIFNAEYDNTAGGKCFSIIDKANHGFIITDTTTNINNINAKVVIDSTAKTFDVECFTGTDGACPWLLFDTTVPAGEHTIKGLAPGYMKYGFYFGINSTNNDDLIFIDSNNYKLNLLETSVLYFYWGNKNDFGKTFSGGSYMPGSSGAFSIESGTGTYTLDSIEGIEVGDIYSLRIGANYDFYGKVTYLDTNNNIVAVSSFTKGTTTDLSDAVMWFPYKPQIGTQVNGAAEHAEGCATTAINWDSHSEGFNTLAEGKHSHAENHSTVAGYASHAEGQNTKALGEWSHAQGMATSALNRYTFSFGNSTVSMENYFDKKVLTTLTNEEIEAAWKKASPRFTCANGYASTAGGNNTLALGAVSTALGKETIAKGNNSLSTGYLTSAEGENSASFGHNTHAIGDNSIAIGDNNTAYGKNSITFGSNNITEWEEYEDETYLYDDSPNNRIDNLQIEGSNNIIKKSQSWPLGEETIIIKNSHIEGANNQFDVRFESKMLCSHIEGRNNKIGGTNLNGSHVEGLNNDMEYPLTDGGNIEASHIEGYNNKIKAIAIQSHIEGAANTIDSADYNKEQVCIHVEGYNNKIFNSNYSHTQGTTNTVTNSPGGHVGGWNNSIKGDGAFAHGHGLKATGACSFVIGRYNVESNANSGNGARFIIGNGTSDTDRSNAFVVTANGKALLPSIVNNDIGTNVNAVATKGYVDSKIRYGNELPTKIPPAGTIFILY